MSKTQNAVFALFLSLLALPQAFAETGGTYGAGGSDASLDETYLTVDHAEFEELKAPNPMNPQKPTQSGLGSDDPVKQIVGDLSAIINIGQQLWNIVSANQPTATTSQNVATAVPDGIKSWTQLAGWQNPQIHNYKVSLKNGYGANVVTFGYQLQFNSGGNLDGRGQFLANGTIRATQVDVLWGYHFSADAAVGDVVNVGSSQDPIAGVNLTVTWKVGTVLKQENGSRTFFVRGDGQVDDLGQ
jgi:hypothetical protein